MPLFGLIGKTLSHSFSQDFFTRKFAELQLTDCFYELYELDDIQQLHTITRLEGLKGVNVTIPYKQSVIPLLDELDDIAKAIGAVNTIKIKDGKLIGYNTDYEGFKISLLDFIPDTKLKALVFGSGGAARAVCKVLSDLRIAYALVSRTTSHVTLSYEQLNAAFINDHKLLINCTPVGTFPDVNNTIPIPFNGIGKKHFCYDLIYNPTETKFLQMSQKQGAGIKNGLEMLHLQAEAAWKIWNT